MLHVYDAWQVKLRKGSTIYACASIYCKKGVTKLSGIGRHALPSNPSFLKYACSHSLLDAGQNCTPSHSRGNMQPGGGGVCVQTAGSCVVAHGLATCHAQVTKTPTTQPMQPCAMGSKRLAFGRQEQRGRTAAFTRPEKQQGVAPQASLALANMHTALASRHRVGGHKLAAPKLASPTTQQLLQTHRKLPLPRLAHSAHTFHVRCRSLRTN